MKKLIMIMTLLTLNASADVYDLRSEGYTGTYCVGDTLTYNLDGEYVEKILISAEGIRNDGFIKVYADGALVQNIGVPGYDPDYSFRVRQNVSNISLKFERTCSRVLDMKIFTEDSSRTSRSSNTGGFHETEWGAIALDIVESMVMTHMLSDDTLWDEFLKPLQVLALKYDAISSVSDLGDLKAALYALSKAKLISDYEQKLLVLAESQRNEDDVRELLRIKEAILEVYDVKERNLDREIKNLEELF